MVKTSRAFSIPHFMAFIFNDQVYTDEHFSVHPGNRGLNYGDGVFETLRYSFGRINFWEDHYFRLMEGMRIMRMEIPMSFSPEFLEEKLKQCVESNGLKEKAARVKILVTRKNGGFYTPESNKIDYLITATPLNEASFQLNERGLNIDLYKDYYKAKGLLSNIKTTSAQLYVVASVYRQENGLDECLLLNPDKEVCEAISSNLFLIDGDELLTPPLSTGCLKGIIRKKILAFAPKIGLTVKEEAFSPFKLQKAEEVFLTNSIQGIRWVERYRKKTFVSTKTSKILQRLNTEVALNSN